jgi:hypothetical protein
MPKHNDEQAVWRKFQIMDEIDSEDYSTESHPNKCFNPQNLTLKDD